MGLENAVAEELATSGAIQEAEGGEAAPRYTRKALDGWALKKCRGLRAGVVDGYTRRGKKVVKMKKLIDVVCDHAKKAGPYVFLAVVRDRNEGSSQFQWRWRGFWLINLNGGWGTRGSLGTKNFKSGTSLQKGCDSVTKWLVR